MLLQNIVQGIQTGQRIGQDRGILQSGVTEQMDLGADLTDADDISLAQRLRTARIGDIHPAVCDQVQCRHWLPIAIYSFTFL